MGAAGRLGPGSPLGVLKVAPAGWSGRLATIHRPSPLRTAGVRRGGPGTSGTEPSGAILYRTTAEFLEYLGLDSLEDLPPLAPYLPDTAALAGIEDEMSERSH